jgi:hypothetical protein
VPPASAVGLVLAAKGPAAKADAGTLEDPWLRICAGGEITSTATAAGVAASIVQQLKSVSVISACRCMVFPCSVVLNVAFFGVR